MSPDGGRAGERARRAPLRPRAEHLGPERRRPLVLDAALRLFVERGYGGASMDAIAAAAGVTKPVVYQCYPSKGALFEALLEREEGRLLGAVGEAIPERVELGGLERVLRDAFTAILSAAAAAPDSWRVVFDSERGSEPAVARSFIRGREMIVERIAQLVEQVLIEAAAKDRERRVQLYAELIASIGQAGVRTLLESGAGWTPDELGAHLAGLAVRALEPA
jgi:AcrR family transcriptional regulator